MSPGLSNVPPDLSHRMVVVTRPVQKAKPLLGALEELDVPVVHLPTLAIKPVELTAQQQGFIENLDLYDLVFFVSSHSADLGMALLQDRWPQWPMGIQWYAVGPATAELLFSYHVRAKTPSTSLDSQGLLALPEMTPSALSGKKALIVRGVGGLDVLSQGLQQRGAEVDLIEVYQRDCPTQAEVENELAVISQVGGGIIHCYSGDSLVNLITLLEFAQISLSRFVLLVISRRIAERANKLGFADVQVVDSHSQQVGESQQSGESKLTLIDQRFLQSTIRVLDDARGVD